MSGFAEPFDGYFAEMAMYAARARELDRQRKIDALVRANVQELSRIASKRVRSTVPSAPTPRARSALEPPRTV